MEKRENSPAENERVDLSTFAELRAIKPTTTDKEFNPNRHKEYTEAHPDIVGKLELAEILNRQELRDLNRDRKTEYELLPEYRRYTLREHGYISLGLSFESFVTAAKRGTLAVEDTFDYLKKTSYIDKEVIIGQRWSSHHVGKFTNEPDERFPFDSTINDRNLHMLIGLKLAQGKFEYTGQKIATLDELLKAYQDNGKNFDTAFFTKTLASLQTRDNIANMIKREVIKEDSLPSLYEKFAVLSSDAAVDATFKNFQQTLTFPYSFTRNDHATGMENYPDIALLPFIANSYLRFMIKIPESIKKGQQIDLATLVNLTHKLNKFNEEVFTAYLGETLGLRGTLMELIEKAKKEAPDVLRDVAIVNNAVDYMSDDFKTVINHYKKHPFLINRVIPGNESSNALTTYPEWRNELIQHGARAPIKPTVFRFKHEVVPE